MGRKQPEERGNPPEDTFMGKKNSLKKEVIILWRKIW